MQSALLKTALLSNAIFSAVSGTMLLFLSHPVADLIGVGDALIYQAVGGGLLGFAAFVAWTGTRKPIDIFGAALISVADGLWVVGTALLIILGMGVLQPMGVAALLVVACVVAFFGVRQLQGIAQCYAVEGKPNTHRLCVAVETPTPAETIWTIIADLPSIRRYSPNLTQVILRDHSESGVGAVRQCTDVGGKTWGEYCKRYDPLARSVVFEFLANEPKFPYPFQTMTGGWEVSASGSGSTVMIWFEVTPKYSLVHPIILALMVRNLANGFGEVVARMTADANGQPVPKEIVSAQYGVTSQLSLCR